MTAVCQTKTPALADAEKLLKDGNYAEAYVIFKKILADKTSDKYTVITAFDKAFQCQQNLGNINEFDGLLESTIKLHGRDLDVAVSIVNHFNYVPNWGFLVDGKFHRGQNRGIRGARYVNIDPRDRIQSVQILLEAIKNAESNKSTDPIVFSKALCKLAGFIENPRNNNGFWALQILTDFSKLPDYDTPEAQTQYHNYPNGLPVDDNGNPVMYKVPASWEAAKNDGERYRWLLDRAAKIEIANKLPISLAEGQFIYFLLRQFGTGNYGVPMNYESVMQLDKLGDDEYITRLATGIKRITLPPDYSFITLSKKVYEHFPNDTAKLQYLANEYIKRRQYVKAVEWLKKIPEEPWAKTRLDNITGNWCEFKPSQIQLTGDAAFAELSFRNAQKATLSLSKIDLQAVKDVTWKAILDEKNADNYYNNNLLAKLSNLLQREDAASFIGKPFKSWEMRLVPKEDYSNKTVRVDLPVNESGAYMLECMLENGNTARIVVMLQSMMIVNKPIEGYGAWQVVDAKSGKPLPNVQVELAGFTINYNQGKRTKHTRTLLKTTDADGFVFLNADEVYYYVDNTKRTLSYQWHVFAKDNDKGCTWLDNSNINYGDKLNTQAPYKQEKFFGLSDRPVYRPGDKVHIKGWLSVASYSGVQNPWANRKDIEVQVMGPQGKKFLETTLKSDEYGGIETEFTLPDSAPLGHYSFNLKRQNWFQHICGFRLEEYKKPEYEVLVDAPKEAVKLGDKIPVTITAKYYFGLPVADAEVKVRVLRHDHSVEWWPWRRWDWLYGNAYWWYYPEYKWYPGWDDWGCCVPPFWRPRRHYGAPEVVMDMTGRTAQDGTYKVTIDSETAMKLYGNRDHRYELTVEVRDKSRRTIVGNASVIASRKPFNIYVWGNQGFYTVSSKATFICQARTPDGKPVKGTGKINLYSVKYDKDGKASESLVSSDDTATDDEGRATHDFIAAKPGQYRIAWTVTNAKGDSVEGACVFIVHGKGAPSDSFRYDGLELVPEKAEYAPGETLRLAVNTAQSDSTVMLFIRPLNGVAPKPQILHLSGKSQLVEIPVTESDYPNFFVEAYTVCDGKVHNVMRQIAVPPAKKSLDIEVVATEKVRPGESADLRIKVTDADGHPVVGRMALSIYDRSVEYIAGSNVPEMKAFFWKWLKHHNTYVNTMHRFFHNILLKDETPMPQLSLFEIIAEALSENDDSMETADYGAGGAMDMKNNFAPRAVGAAPRKAMKSKAAPAAAPLMMGAAKEEMAMDGAADEAESPSENGGGNAPAIRKNFADTAYWNGSLDTDTDGTAVIKVPMPESLTSWKIRVWAMGDKTCVGTGEGAIITAKDLMIRLQSPRFYVERDEICLSAIVNSTLPSPEEVTVSIEQDGKCLKFMDKVTRKVKVANGGEVRIDWRVKALAAGEAILRVKAIAKGESDAMEQKFPVLVHGMDKMLSYSRLLPDGKDSVDILLDIPKKIGPDTANLEVRWSPSLAMAMTDAIPYLASYPYGCTEQTLNRFLPAVITRSVIERTGIDMADIAKRRNNLNAQEIGNPDERRAQWKRYDSDPVFDKATLDKMVDTGVTRLVSMQCGDGGWGWFSGYGERSYPHTTAIVVRGLKRALDCKVDVPKNAISRGAEWLARYQAGEIEKIRNAEKKDKDKKLIWKNSADNLDALVYLTLVEHGKINEEMREFLFRDKNHLSLYGKSLFATALHLEGDKRLPEVMRNIRQFLVIDDENQTAYLNTDGAFWWYWYGDSIETQAAYLRLLALTEPKSDVAPRMVKYLLNNRKHGTYWNSTRDTAACLDAFAEFIAATGEDKPDMTVEILLDGKVAAESKITADNLFTANLTLQQSAIKPGHHTVTIRRKGNGPLYCNAYLSYFTMEDRIRGAGLEVRVERKIFRLEKDDRLQNAATATGAVTQKLTEHVKRIQLNEGDKVKSGDLLEVQLTFTSKNDYEYILVEDFRPAGTECVDTTSGYVGNSIGAYMEFRDTKTAMMLRQLPRGTSILTYRLRAEAPGTFSAMPTVISGMYAPELKGNADELHISITE